MSLYIPVCVEHCNPVITPCFTWGVTHSLVTAYPFVLGKKPLSVLQYHVKTASSQFMILDSGIYSLVKDMHQGKNVTPEFLYDYAKRYIALIKQIGWKGVIIEVDSHTVLPDLDLLKRIRGLFEDAGLVRQTLFVWHLPERLVGLEALLSKYPRIAIAPREIFNFTADNTTFQRLMNRYKKEVATKHIHCLGTNRMGAQDMPDNFSFDTTSWASISMYGLTDAGLNTMSFRDGKRIVQPHIHKEVLEHMDGMLNNARKHPEYKVGAKIRRNYITMMSCGLRSTVLHYEAVRRKTPHTDMKIIDPLDYTTK